MAKSYVGFHNDMHGMTQLGRVVLDAWVFELIPESEDCAGWSLPRLQMLMGRVETEWDKYGNLPSRLPSALRERHQRIYEQAVEQGRKKGWDPELGDER
mgnify:CR=1 FL=1